MLFDSKSTQGKFVIIAGSLILLLCLGFSENLKAEGSKDMIASGIGHRAHFLSSALGGEGIPFPTNGTVKVYAQPGERLYIGSSALGLGSGRINVRAPQGTGTYTTNTQGLIANRNQEIFGPSLNSGVDGGYVPYILTVGATQGGVWEIDFISPSPGTDPRSVGGTNHPAANPVGTNWMQTTTVPYITAFDVSVRNGANTEFLKGRAFMNVFNGTLSHQTSLFYAQFNILTYDGYLYEVNNNGQAGYIFSFFVNNKGFRDGANNPIYRSVTSATTVNTQDPRANDTATDFTHKIFFNTPADDLPEEAFTPSSSTWLKKAIKTLSVSDVLFTGQEGTDNKAGTNPLGGWIKFKTSQPGSYDINIDINNNGVFSDAIDVKLTGSALNGSNSVYWDGLNGNGNKVNGGISFNPNQLQVSLVGGEVHFPFLDVENNVNGIIIKRVSGANSPDYTVHWNDSPIASNTNAPNPKTTLAGGVNSSTSGHKYGSTAYSTNAYGNQVGLDTWAYLVSSPEVPYLDITFREANLEVLPITTNKLTPYCVGEDITYTVVVRNNGPDNVAGAKFFFDYPAEFNVTSVTTAFSSANLGNQLVNSQIMNPRYLAELNLINGATITFTIKGALSAAPVGGVFTKAAIMRPADVTDPDATNPDSAVPTNPQDECDWGTAGCNNIKTHNSITLTGVSVSLGGNQTVVEGTGVTKTITFPVNLSAASNCDIKVDYALTHNTINGTNNADFLGALNGTLVITAGQVSGNIIIQIATDNIIERNEEFTLTISNPSGLNTINVPSATGTIENDDQGVINITKVDGYEEGAIPAKLIFSFANGVTSDCDYEIDYKLSGTASWGGVDYTGTELNTAIIAAGQSTFELLLPVNNDAIVEGNETVFLSSIESTRSIRPENGSEQLGYSITINPIIPVITIFDNDKASIKINPFVTLNEGDDNYTDFIFNITLDARTSGVFTLNFKTSNGSALSSDNDYEAKNEVVNFTGQPGTFPVIVRVKGDDIIEASEYFHVTISDLSNTYNGNLTISQATSVGNIINDDSGILDITAVGTTEGAAAAQFVFTLREGKVADTDMVISYTLTGKANGSGMDYDKPQTGTITLLKGQNTVSLYLNTYDDNLIEGTEDVVLTVDSWSNPAISLPVNTQSLNILDINSALITVADVQVLEGNAGTTTLRFKVLLNGRTDTDFTLPFTIQDVTTTFGTDYTVATISAISFSPNQATQEIPIDITVNGDYDIEGHERLQLVLGTPSKTFNGGLNVQVPPAIGTILDDDSGQITVTATHGKEENEEPVVFTFAFPAGVTSVAPTVIEFTLAGSTAIAGEDYVAPVVPYQVTIPAGENSIPLIIPVNDDDIVEGTQTIVLTPSPIIGNPGVTINTAAVIAQIEDNDTGTITITGPPTVIEGDAGVNPINYTIKLDKEIQSTIQLSYRTADVTALAGEDYNGVLNTYTFRPGFSEWEIIVPVGIMGDKKIEANEIFRLMLNPLLNDFGGRLTIPTPFVETTILNDDAADITITKIDGIEGSQDGRFTIGFEDGYSTDIPITLYYSLGGNATIGLIDADGVDYLGNATGSFTIPPGQSNYVIDLPIIHDDLVEKTENIILDLVNATLPYGIAIADLSNTVQVIDNSLAEIGISDVSVTEGDGSDVNLIFNVALSGNKVQDPFQLDFEIQAVSATEGVDYILPVNTFVLFNGPNDRNKQIVVIVKGDKIIEANETLKLVLEPLSQNFGGRLRFKDNKTEATGTIIDNDLGIIDITHSNANEEGLIDGEFKFELRDNIIADEPITVNFNLTSGSATMGATADYTVEIDGLTVINPTSITIPAGESSKTIKIKVIDDEIVEGTETVVLTTTGVTSTYSAQLSIQGSPKTLDIIDNDKAEIILIGISEDDEGDASEKTITYTVTLNKATSGQFSVKYDFSDITATNGTGTAADYFGTNGTLVFNGTKDQTHPITFKIFGDKVIEADEKLKVNLSILSDVSHYGIGALKISDSSKEKIFTIKNDDTAQITITPGNGKEGVTNGSFTFNLPTGVTVDENTVIHYQLSSTTASAVSDYTTPTIGTVTILAGESSATLPVVLVNDNILELQETLNLAITNIVSAYGVTAVSATSAITIDDDDTATITLTAPTAQTEKDSSEEDVYFTVKLSHPIASNVSLPFQTQDQVNGASSSEDYVAVNSSLTFLAGTTAQELTIPVKIKGDKKIEKNEAFNLVLGALSQNFEGRLTVVNPVASYTILNDDAAEILIKAYPGKEGDIQEPYYRFEFKDGYTSDEPVTFNYVLGGTANSGDYSTTYPTTITIPAGRPYVDLVFNVNDDDLVEKTETIFFNSINTSSAYPGLITLDTARPVIDIEDNDVAQLLLTGTTLINEGNIGDENEAIYTLKLTKSTQGQFIIKVATADLTAHSTDFDYAPYNEEIIHSGDKDQEIEIKVKIIGDNKVENPENFIFNILSISDDFEGHLEVPVNSITTTIANDDLAEISISTQNGEEAPANNKDGVFTFSLPAGITVDKPIEIHYSLSGKATPSGINADYQPVTGIVILPANTNNISVNIKVNDDDVIEGDETVIITATIPSPVYGIGFKDNLNTSTLTIIDNDYGTVSINNVSVQEQHAGEHTLSFTVSISKDTQEPFKIFYKTDAGTATAGTDYLAVNNGEKTISRLMADVNTINITYYGDRIVEKDETFKLILESLEDKFSGHLTLHPTQHTGTATLVNDDIAIVKVEAFDGTEDGTSGVFKFTLTDAGGNLLTSDQPVVLTYEFDGIAQASGTKADFTTLHPTTITIPANSSSSVDLLLNIVNDEIVEGTEQVILKNLAIFNSPYPGITLQTIPIPGLNIIDNDVAKLILTAAEFIDEGDENEKDYEFTLTLDKETAGGFNINYATHNGSALTADDDYIFEDGTLTFTGAKNESYIVKVKIKGDHKIEPDEVFTLDFENPTVNFGNRLSIPQKSIEGKIKNDDFANIIITKQDGAEGGQPASFIFTLANNKTVDEDIYINYTLDNISAIAGTDFTVSAPSSLLLEKGSNSVTLTLAVTDDNIVEGTETVKITAQTRPNPRNNITISNPVETLSIEDNDQTVLVITNPQVLESNSGETNLVFSISINKPTQRPFTASYKTEDISATSGEDYIAVANGSVTFPAFSTAPQTITIKIKGDQKLENDETFSLLLTALTEDFGGKLSLPATAATGKIINDDAAVITISGTNGQETNETSGTFKFSLPNNIKSDQPIKINYTLGGDALGNGIDYTNTLSGFVIIPANESDVLLNINVKDDNILEYDESVIINASIDNATAYSGQISLSNNTRTIFIEDDDSATLKLSGAVQIPEGDDGFTPVIYTVALSNPVTAGFKVNYNVEEMSALISDEDFQFSPGEFQFTGLNANSETFTIYVKGDKKIEANETFRITLTPDKTFGNRLTVQGAPLLVEITNDDSGSISITKEDGEEKLDNSAPAKFIFSLPDGISADQDIVLPYSLSVNSARGEDVDYTGNLTGSITIYKNDNQAVLTLPVIDDNIVENTETVTLQIGNVTLPYGITLPETSKTLNIFDNDEAQLSISNATVVEGNSGTSYLDFTLSINKAVQESFTINYHTEDGTATAGEDYHAITPANGSLTFNALDVASKNIRVNVNTDLKIEANETLQLVLQTLSNNFGGKLHLPQAAGVGTIENDDSAVITISGADGKEAGELAGTFKFSLPANVTSDQPIKINYTLSGEALANGVDYTNALSGEIIIPANAPDATLNINVKNDNIVEFNESVIITASIANGSVYYPANISLANTTHTIDIVDNDTSTLSIDGPKSIEEGDFGTKTLTFNVALSHPVASSFTVKYHSANGTATIADNDYQAVGGTLSFAGQNADETYPIQVTINGDTKIEGNEYFELLLDPLTQNYGGRVSITGSPARAIILDDDNANINKVITITKQDGEEGVKDASFTFSFPPGVSLDTDTEIFFSLGGNAIKDTDYETIGSSSSLIIPAGQNSKTLNLQVFNDTIIEGTEDVRIITANISNSLYQDITISNPIYSLDIVDNDNGTITIDAVSITEGNADTKEMVFNVVLSNETSREFQLDYYTENGTATIADNDYVEITDGVLVLGPQAATKQIKVFIKGDINIEKDEIFNLVFKPLADSFNGRLTFVNQTAEGKIINDDTSIITITKTDGEEGVGPVRFKFSFPENVFSDELTKINYSLSGSAIANLDYNGNATGTIEILPYQNSAELVLPVVDDNLIEGTETVVITADAISIYGNAVTINPVIPIANIKDNDTAKLKINGPITVTEGNIGTTPVNFTVTLEGNIGESFDVKFSTQDGSATVADNDYIPKTDQILNFSGNPGESKTITIFANGDRNIEANENFFVNLHDLSKNFNGLLTIENSPAEAIILDDDNNPANKSITITRTNGSEVDLSPVTFTFSFPAGVVSDAITTIPYSLSGTATGNGVDYDGIVSGNIAIPAGENSITLTLPVKTDAITEGAEIVKLTTGEVINGSYNGIRVVNSIIEAEIEDANTTSLTIDDIEIVEGNTGTSTATFKLKLNGATAKPFTVDYQTANGTATVADFDYMVRSEKLSFNGLAGEEREVTITINGDKKLEADETFKLLLSNIQSNFDGRLILDRTEAIATIKNDDDLIITVTGTNGAEAGRVAGRFIFSLPLGYTSDIPTLINYTLGGQATAGGTDYVGSVNGVIAIPAGEERVILSLPVIDDEIIEKDETISITINSINTNYPGNISYNPTLPIIKIIDNDATVLRLSNTLQLKEGNSGTTPFEYTLTLEKATGTGFTVKYDTEDGTATLADNDYNRAEGTLSFSGTAGESHTVTVFVNGDLKIEANELFKFKVFDLDSTFNNRLTIPVAAVNGIIENDDSSLITITKVDGIEGTQNGQFDLTLDPGVTSDRDITVSYRLGGTATTSDYTANPSATTVTIPAGQSSVSISIDVVDDNFLEETETVVLNVLNIINPYNNVTVKLPVPILNIYDNDITKLAIISPAAIDEGHSGVKSVTFTLKLENTTDKGFTVQYATVDGSATETDNDYQKKTGSLSFAGFGGETKTITVFINGDTKPESHEFFGLRIFNPLPDFDGKLLLDTNGRATILNDDIAPVAADDFITIIEDTPETFSVITNDSHAEGINPATITITVVPANGLLVPHSDGTVTYSPKLNFFGNDSFTYTVRDIYGRYSNEARVNITVIPVNDAPIANDDIYYVQRDSSIRENVSLNDEDPDGDVLVFRRISNPEHGNITLFDGNDGTFIYVPEEGFKGIDKFTYYIQDPEGLRDTAEVTLYIQPKIRIDLTPNTGILIEGDTISITAKLTEFIYQDVNVVLNFGGTAEINKDYTLSGNYDVITIPARDTITTQKFSINSLKDYLKEGEETVEVSMIAVDPAAFVEIGDGADIIIKDFYPGDKPLDPDENGDINPDPYMSPNGDGLGNEKFVIYNIERYPDNEVIIYNRWGNEVYTTKGYDNKDNAFNGSSNKGMLANSNSPLVDGVYYFIIKTKGADGKPKRNKGYVIIRR